MGWKKLEEKVRLTASYLWNAPADSEKIKGVNVDCVLKIKNNYWVAIEITKTKRLAKFRNDLAKFASIRPHLFDKDIYVECFFICEIEPSPSMVETGKGHHVKVMSYHSFEKMFFDFTKYYHERSQRRFGSAVDPYSGKKDERAYIPIEYIGVSANENYNIEDIANLLLKGKRIILLGNYGTGKSRCMQELFLKLGESGKKQMIFPFCFNLRNFWGSRRSHEIIRRHFDDLGLSQSADSAIKIFEKNMVIFLLDGFDEIGSQAWVDNPDKLRIVRSESLLGVKDLIKRSSGGLIITGREHYFNHNREMFECLGLDEKTTIIIKCPEEFSDDVMTEYLKNISDKLILPSWLPKRPLICQIINTIDNDLLENIVNEAPGELEFWDIVIDAICTREAKINVAIDSETVKALLILLSRVTRSKPNNVGPITFSDIKASFEKIVGISPNDEAAVMIQRLPTLGRIEAESTDRHFVDPYILDGFRAEDVINIVSFMDENVKHENWINPLCNFGTNLVAKSINDTNNYVGFMKYLNLINHFKNRTLIGDIFSSLINSYKKDLDFNNISIDGTHISNLNLANSRASNFYIFDSYIERLDITATQVRNVIIKDCVIKKVYGVSAEKNLPEWMKNNDIELYEAVNRYARIKRAPLRIEQNIFCIIIMRTFFQPGSGRKEDTLVKGYGVTSNKKIVYKILNMLLSEGILTKSKGDSGNVYNPTRRYTKRMEQILTELNNSKDELWLRLDEFKK